MAIDLKGWGHPVYHGCGKKLRCALQDDLEWPDRYFAFPVDAKEPKVEQACIIGNCCGGPPVSPHNMGENYEGYYSVWLCEDCVRLYGLKW